MIGSHLLLELVKKGFSVRATYRSFETIKKTERVFSYYGLSTKKVHDNIQWVEANITDVFALERAVEDINMVYHCAALISFDPKEYRRLVKINIEGTKNIVNVCLKNDVKKLCHVSSIATLGSAKNGESINEESEWSDKNTSVYARTKRNAELEVWRGIQEGLNAVIVNPGVVLGPGFWKSGSGVFFYHAAKEQNKTLPGGTGFIAVQDVINSMVQLMVSDISNARFILVDKNLTYVKIMAQIATHLGVTPPTKTFTKFELETFWRIDWIRANFFGKRRRLSKNIAKTLRQRDTYSSKKIRENLAIEFRHFDNTVEFTSRLFQEDYPKHF